MDDKGVCTSYSSGIVRHYTAETIASLTGYAYLVDAIKAL
jgi:hypothetical protein